MRFADPTVRFVDCPVCGVDLMATERQNLRVRAAARQAMYNHFLESHRELLGEQRLRSELQDLAADHLHRRPIRPRPLPLFPRCWTEEIP